MSHIEIVVPFGLPPEQLAPGILREWHAPSLATLVSRTRARASLPNFDADARALPHEAWLAFQFGLTETIDSRNSPPFSPAAMHLRGLAQDKGFWFILHPAHVRVMHDTLAMADRRLLALPPAESLALFNAAQPCFDEAGKTLLYGDPMTWFVRADDWHDLRTATPDAACNRNLAHWMPEGGHELGWRKLLNDVQMLWHTHAVNAARLQRGALPVNGLWLWGGAWGGLPAFPAILPYTAAIHFAGRMEAYGQYFPENEPNASAADVVAHPPEHGLVLLDELIAPALAADWQQWRTAHEKLEDEWFAPLLEGLERGRFSRMTLHLSNDHAFRSFIADRSSLRKFWRRRSLGALVK